MVMFDVDSIEIWCRCCSSWLFYHLLDLGYRWCWINVQLLCCRLRVVWGWLCWTGHVLFRFDHFLTLLECGAIHGCACTQWHSFNCWIYIFFVGRLIGDWRWLFLCFWGGGILFVISWFFWLWRL